MKPIHVYKLSVYNKPDGDDLNAEEIQEFIKTELDQTYQLSVFEVEWQGVIRTDEISHDE
jgi:hypothetical protein